MLRAGARGEGVAELGVVVGLRGDEKWFVLLRMGWRLLLKRAGSFLGEARR